MFDIGFSELVLIFIVGLVVLGPQRMPVAIRTVMGWVRTIRGLAHNVQTELAQELKLQELQESIKKAEQLNLTQLSPELSKTVDELKQSAQKMQSELNNAKANVQALSSEQVAEIQQKIEQESQALAQAEAAEKSTNNVDGQNGNELQYSAQNAPLAIHPEDDLSPEEIAEFAHLDEAQLSAYYPPDDELATVEPVDDVAQDKKNVS